MASDRVYGLGAPGMSAPGVTRSSSIATLTAEPSAFLWNVPMVVVCLLVLNHFGRPFEFFLTGFKIPFVICLVGGLVALTTRAMKAFDSAPGIPLVCLILWMALATGLSNWRGGSANFLLYFVGLEIVLFLLAASAPRSFADIRKVAYFVLGAYILYSVIASVNGKDITRFDLKGTFGNADDVALLAGFVIPFLVLAALQMRNPAVKAIVMVAGCGFLLRTVGMTGTRAAIPALIGMLGVYFLRGTGTQRLMVVVMTAVGIVAMIAILPTTILTRFATITKSFDSEKVMEESTGDEAMGSLAERTDLVKDGIRMTITHPIFGVGPNEYSDYRSQHYDNGAGGRKRFFPPHNTFIEVSSEEGIPGLICYVSFLVGVLWITRQSIRLNQPNSHPDWKVGYRTAVALEAALVYFAICAGFMTCETHPHQYLVAGLAVALYRISVFRVTQSQKLSALSVSIPTSLTSISPAAAVPVHAALSAARGRDGAAVPVGPVAPRGNSLLRRPR
jgi:putative inorganic carbon (hco3(-)) transporter